MGGRRASKRRWSATESGRGDETHGPSSTSVFDHKQLTKLPTKVAAANWFVTSAASPEFVVMVKRSRHPSLASAAKVSKTSMLLLSRRKVSRKDKNTTPSIQTLVIISHSPRVSFLPLPVFCALTPSPSQSQRHLILIKPVRRNTL